MIAYISGKILDLNEKFLIVDVNGLGYKVFISTDTLSGLSLGQTVSLYTYLAVREDALDLYGFSTDESQGFFELLISVSGIGPRSALSILSLAPIETLKKAIATGDTGYLTKVSGIGRKTAEKIVIELRDKLVAHKNESVNLRGEHDTLEALKSLGYSQNEAREALKDISPEITDTNTRIREALKQLGRSS
jgi:Holliday junction DNA helicase RuvA